MWILRAAQEILTAATASVPTSIPRIFRIATVEWLESVFLRKWY
jgi:hypothetical protein